MNISQINSLKSRHFFNPPCITKRGRFIIEDYSDYIVKDYNKFVNTLKKCDTKLARVNEDNIRVLLNIIEIQNKQINLMKEVFEKEGLLDDKFNKSSEMINKLIQDVKKKI
ncbi:uncharacterized protein VNE69_01401 [Vairimorpha necatrix]|uniref:Uncharacterized protein n=1 Tax=Vairimorpha necatrix TaxID=6039 RepID=A0AAX4J949_9MICR